jgi:hypothetical protein
MLFASIPFKEFEVTFWLKITGPLNLEILSDSAPPSTVIDLLIETISGVIYSTASFEYRMFLLFQLQRFFCFQYKNLHHYSFQCR